MAATIMTCRPALVGLLLLHALLVAACGGEDGDPIQSRHSGAPKPVAKAAKDDPTMRAVTVDLGERHDIPAACESILDAPYVVFSADDTELTARTLEGDSCVVDRQFAERLAPSADGTRLAWQSREEQGGGIYLTDIEDRTTRSLVEVGQPDNGTWTEAVLLGLDDTGETLTLITSNFVPVEAPCNGVSCGGILKRHERVRFQQLEVDAGDVVGAGMPFRFGHHELRDFGRLAPDGEHVAVANVDLSAFTISDGSDVEIWDQLRDNGFACAHDWSPDGSRLVYGQSDESNTNVTLVTSDPNGKHPIKIGAMPDGCYDVIAVSPNGRQVLLGAFHGLRLFENGPRSTPGKAIDVGGSVGAIAWANPTTAVVAVTDDPSSEVMQIKRVNLVTGRSITLGEVSSELDKHGLVVVERNG